ncbi:Rieske (2Fe-2S) protein [Corynebacterium callunae]|uniref:Rieske (2Fe-2S) protein n=1 Tax=Corynebacterium callunae TaxID=1721 RepID=UPI0039822B24
MTESALSCSRRTFILGTATTFAGAFLAACGTSPNNEVAATEVPVGSAVTLDTVIIAQPTEGNFVAYSATCPHAGSRITKVEGDTVRCLNHNSVFKISDGSVVSGPAETGLTSATLTQNGDQLSATTE